MLSRIHILIYLSVIAGASACSDDDAAHRKPHDAGPGADSGGSPSRCAPLHDAEALFETWTQAWLEDDTDARDCLLAKALIEEVIYLEPNIIARDRAALSDEIGKFVASTPGAGFSISGTEIRDRDMRGTWDSQVDGVTTGSGTSYIQFASDGRIATVLDYFEPPVDRAPVPALSAYVDAWNASDAAARQTALAEAMVDDVRMEDGADEAEGTTEVASAIAAARSEGVITAIAVLVETYRTPATHGRVQFEFEHSDGSTTTATDYFRFAADGRIEIIGHFADP